MHQSFGEMGSLAASRFGSERTFELPEVYVGVAITEERYLGVPRKDIEEIYDLLLTELKLGKDVAILVHRFPDADAGASAEILKAIIHDIDPSRSIRIFHSDEALPPLSKAGFQGEALEALESLIRDKPSGVSLFLLDASDSRSHHVRGHCESAQFPPPFLTLDHHDKRNDSLHPFIYTDNTTVGSTGAILMAVAHHHFKAKGESIPVTPQWKRLGALAAAGFAADNGINPSADHPDLSHPRFAREEWHFIKDVWRYLSHGDRCDRALLDEFNVPEGSEEFQHHLTVARDNLLEDRIIGADVAITAIDPLFDFKRDQALFGCIANQVGEDKDIGIVLTEYPDRLVASIRTREPWDAGRITCAIFGNEFAGGRERMGGSQIPIDRLAEILPQFSFDALAPLRVQAIKYVAARLEEWLASTT